MREWRASALSGGISPFLIFPENDRVVDDETEPGTPWRKADLERAFDVAEAAGLAAYRVEIAPDGTISIIVDDSDEAEPAPD